MPAVFKNQLDRLGKALQTRLIGLPLAVGTGDFVAVGDEPVAVVLDNDRELMFRHGLLSHAPRRIARP
jgi:hypothetical protein